MNLMVIGICDNPAVIGATSVYHGDRDDRYSVIVGMRTAVCTNRMGHATIITRIKFVLLGLTYS